MSVVISLPGLKITLRHHAATVGLALGAAALSLAAYAVTPPTRVASAKSLPQFEQNCVACHGADALGVEGLGVNLVESAFVAQKTEPELVAFLKQGRLPDDPASRTQRPMPSFSWVPEADLQAIASYLKNTIAKKQSG
jgi:mono/diheme cytochrome c family protein